MTDYLVDNSVWARLATRDEGIAARLRRIERAPADLFVTCPPQVLEFIASKMTKPVSAYIAGQTAPAGKKMGHAGAIVSGGKGTAAAKMEALSAAGVRVGANPTEAGELMVEIINGL